MCVILQFGSEGASSLLSRGEPNESISLNPKALGLCGRGTGPDNPCQNPFLSCDAQVDHGGFPTPHPADAGLPRRNPAQILVNRRSRNVPNQVPMDPQDGPSPSRSEQSPASAPSPGRWKRFLNTCRAHRGKSIVYGLALFMVLGLFFMDALLAGPMRRWAEQAMNSKLKGYTVRIARVRPHLWRMAFDLDDLVLIQNTHPDPPVADFGSLQFSLVLAELLRLKVAGDLTIVRPALHLNLTQIEEEANNHVGLKEQGWQSAVESVYPIKLDRVSVQDGSLLYLAKGTASKPIQLTKVYMVTKNVRNIAAAKSTYPSPVTLEGVLFDTGKVWFQGAADFLREPYAAAQGEVRLEQVPLDRLSPLAESYQLKTTGGFLSMKGSVEYTPEAQKAHLSEVDLENLRADYVTSKATRAVEK